MEHTPPRRVQPCEEAAEKRLEWMQCAQQQLAQNSAEKSAKQESARLRHTRKLSFFEWFLDFPRFVEKLFLYLFSSFLVLFKMLFLDCSQVFLDCSKTSP